MNISTENLDELNAVLTLEVKKEDYEERVKNVLKDHRRKASIPGFRAGKVPFGMIQKMYGKPVLVEEINKLVSESISKYISDEKLNLLGEPLPHEDDNKTIDFDTDAEFEFKFDLGLAPEFELKLSAKDKVTHYKIKIDDALIDKNIENYTQRFGEFSQVDSVEEKDMLTAKLVQLNDKDEVLEGGIFVDEARLATDIIKDAAIKKQILKVKANDELIIDIKKAYPNDTEIAALLKIKTEEVANVSGNFKVAISEIQRFKNAEVNQELFDKIHGEGNIKSLEEFRAKTAEEAENNMKNDTNYKFKIDVKENLVKKFKKDLPEKFLKRWLLAVNENKFTKEDIEKEFDKFAIDLKWQIIKDRIIKENNISVSEEDLKAGAIENARMQFAYYGMNNVPDEHLQQFAQRTFENEEEMRKLHETKIEDKVIDFVKETVKLDEKEISLDKFNKMLEKK